MSFTVTITPEKNALTLAGPTTYDENVRVGIPPKGAVAKIDVYFLTDSTASMTAIINAVKAGAARILNQLREKAQNVGADLHFGVGNYRDLDFPAAERFAHQLPLTSSGADAEAAIGQWTAKSGKTVAEGQLYALDQLAQPPGGTIGWRPDAKRIVVWFGDAPGHEPICQAISGLDHAVTEDSVKAKLTAQGIIAVVISTPAGGSSSPGLDVDPVAHAGGGDYESQCGRLGGTAGQGSRIAAATGGTYADGINADTVVDTIIRLGGAQVESIGSVRLAAHKRIAPFVAAIKPEGGHGPFEGHQSHEADFMVSFTGVSPASGSASKTKPVTVNGSLDVWIDGVLAGAKAVTVTVPDLAGRYKIQNVKSGKLLQVANPSWDGDGGNVSQGPDQSASHQQWELIPVVDGGYRIKNLNPTRVRLLEVKGQSTENKAEILTRENPSGNHKQWLLIPVGADTDGVIFKIQNLHSGKVLDVPGGSDADGVNLWQWGYWGDYPSWVKKHQQHWRLLAL